MFVLFEVDVYTHDCYKLPLVLILGGMMYRNSLIYRAAGLAIFLLPVFGFAEEATQDSAMEEVIVTATYRDTRLMDTPITITAVTAAQIELKGIEDIQTLYQSIPGLSYRTNSQTYNTLSIRGITPPAAGGSSAVGFYMDNMPITDSANGGIRQSMGTIFDIERIEVLKGPQGTLYGEGAMGGNIRYITNKPDPSALDYSVRLNGEAIGDSDGISTVTNGMINIPIAERLAARVVAYKRDRNGVLDQVAPRSEEDVDTVDETGVRAMVSFYPSDEAEITLFYNRVEADYGGPGLGFHCFNVGTPSDPNGQVPIYDLPGTTCAGEYDVYNSGDPYVTHLAHPTMTSGGNDKQDMLNLSISWDLPFGATLTSSTTQFDRKSQYSEETSPRYAAGLQGIVDLSCYGFNPACVPGSLWSMAGDGAFANTTDRFAQELRLVSNTDSDWQWTVGAYYKDEDNTQNDLDACTMGGSPVYDTFEENCYLQYAFDPAISIDDQRSVIQTLTAFVPGNRIYKNLTEESIYGEVGYAFSERWEALVGLRYARTGYGLENGASGSVVRSEVDLSLQNDTTSTSPKFTLTWRPETENEVMVYATWSNGFRPGIINPGVVVRLAELAPLIADDPIAKEHYDFLESRKLVEGDEANNIELGIKATVADGRVSFTGSLYSIDWKDMIISYDYNTNDVAGITPFTVDIIENAGGAESQGLEFEIRAQLADNWGLNVGGDINWTAKITDATGLEGAQASGRYGGVGISEGNRLANAPKNSAFAALTYDFTARNFEAQARLDAYHVAESWNTANNERPAPAYQTVDARVTFYKDKWKIGAYIRNLADEIIVYEFNQVGFRYGRPRTVGFELTYTGG